MSGHSKWSQIKHQKEVADQKRGRVFSKLLSAIAIAARGNPSPEFNPKLRAAIQKAKDSNVPSDNIERAIKRAADPAQNLEELILEGYGSGGVAILIEVITSNKNRTISEVKNLLLKMGGKWAEPGSVRWAFEKPPEDSRGAWRPKFPHRLSDNDKQKLASLVATLESHPDIQDIYTNAAI